MFEADFWESLPYSFQLTVSGKCHRSGLWSLVSGPSFGSHQPCGPGESQALQVPERLHTGERVVAGAGEVYPFFRRDDFHSLPSG